MSDEKDWSEAAEALCEAVYRAAPDHLVKVRDALYDALLVDVQTYLRENVDYNLSHELSRAEDSAAQANNALRNVARDLGVDVRGFPNYPTPEMIEALCLEAIAKLTVSA